MRTEPTTTKETTNPLIPNPMKKQMLSLLAIILMVNPLLAQGQVSAQMAEEIRSVVNKKLVQGEAIITPEEFSGLSSLDARVQEAWLRKYTKTITNLPIAEMVIGVQDGSSIKRLPAVRDTVVTGWLFNLDKMRRGPQHKNDDILITVFIPGPKPAPKAVLSYTPGGNGVVQQADDEEEFITEETQKEEQPDAQGGEKQLPIGTIVNIGGVDYVYAGLDRNGVPSYAPFKASISEPIDDAPAPTRTIREQPVTAGLQMGGDFTTATRIVTVAEQGDQDMLADAGGGNSQGGGQPSGQMGGVKMYQNEAGGPWYYNDPITHLPVLAPVPAYGLTLGKHDVLIGNPDAVAQADLAHFKVQAKNGYDNDGNPTDATIAKFKARGYVWNYDTRAWGACCDSFASYGRHGRNCGSFVSLGIGHNHDHNGGGIEHGQQVAVRYVGDGRYHHNGGQRR